MDEEGRVRIAVDMSAFAPCVKAAAQLVARAEFSPPLRPLLPPVPPATFFPSYGGCIYDVYMPKEDQPKYVVGRVWRL